MMALVRSTAEGIHMQTRLTVESIAPVINGEVRPAPQPLGTWMSRWASIYLDAPSSQTDTSTTKDGWVKAA
jgi:hypothetical protein